MFLYLLPTTKETWQNCLAALRFDLIHLRGQTLPGSTLVWMRWGWENDEIYRQVLGQLSLCAKMAPRIQGAFFPDGLLFYPLAENILFIGTEALCQDFLTGLYALKGIPPALFEPGSVCRQEYSLKEDVLHLGPCIFLQT